MTNKHASYVVQLPICIVANHFLNVVIQKEQKPCLQNCNQQLKINYRIMNIQTDRHTYVLTYRQTDEIHVYHVSNIHTYVNSHLCLQRLISHNTCLNNH